MTTQTIIIIAVVAVVWAVAFTIMLSMGKKRENSEKKFNEDNRDKGVLHIYGKQIKIDGSGLVNVALHYRKGLGNHRGLDTRTALH